jgi:FkbM family methyltransferase
MNNKIINPFIYELIDKHQMPNPTIPGWLEESYAQRYDDVVVDQLIAGYLVRNKLSRLSLSYIEIGANHPVCTNSTYLLYKKYGANGILVEANPKLAANLKQFRPRDEVIQAAVVASDVEEITFYLSPENEISSVDKSFVERWKDGRTGIQQEIKVKTVRVNQLLERMVGVDSLYLSIDVEGLDYEVLCDIDFSKYRPHIIQIEPSDHFIPGNSIRIMEYLKLHDYKLIAQNQTNQIYVDNRRD